MSRRTEHPYTNVPSGAPTAQGVAVTWDNKVAATRKVGVDTCSYTHLPGRDKPLYNVEYIQKVPNCPVVQNNIVAYLTFKVPTVANTPAIDTNVVCKSKSIANDHNPMATVTAYKNAKK